MSTGPIESSASEPDRPPTPLPAWAPIPAYVLASVVGAAALAASGLELYSLARNASAPMLVCIALFVGLDSGGAAAGIAWVASRREPTSPLHQFGKRVTLGLVGASSLLNGVSVLADPHRNKSLGALLPWEVITGFAVLIAVSFPWVAMAMIHLVLLVVDQAPAKVKRVTPAATEESAVGERAPESVETTTEDVPDTFEEIVEGLEDVDQTGPIPTVVDLVDVAEVDRIAAALRETHNRATIREMVREAGIKGVLAQDKEAQARALAYRMVRERAS